MMKSIHSQPMTPQKFHYKNFAEFIANTSALKPLPILEAITDIWLQWRHKKLPLYLFLAMCFNLVVAPVVYAATELQLSRTQSWALGLLGIVTVGLSIYLFFVMFVPEKF